MHSHSPASVAMERQPTKPAPIPTSLRKKRKTELDLAIESIRQDVTDKAETELMEKDFDPEDFEKFFGPPKQKREEVSDEQFEEDTAEFFEECSKGFFKRMERFNELMAHWKTMPNYDVDFKTDLQWLEEHVAPHMERRKRNSMQQTCPFHPLEPLKVLNPDAECGPLYCKCPEDQCPVWCTSDTVSIVLPELIENTHPEVRAKLTEIKCKCSEVPRMKLSRSEKNKHKVFLTCGRNPRQNEVCGYFQWMHAPLWKPKRPLQPTLDKWVKTPVGEYFAPDQKKKPFACGFKPPVFGETAKPVKSFEELCDEQNAERVKHNCAPYSYETYRRYGLGIF